MPEIARRVKYTKAARLCETEGEMKQAGMEKREEASGLGPPQLVERVGAGDLIARVYKVGNEDSEWSYRFSIGRIAGGNRAEEGRVFVPKDVLDFPKLCKSSLQRSWRMVGCPNS